MDLLRSLTAFLRTVDTGSFAAVARETRESHSAVTRRIAQLEEHFGVRLLQRTTRRLSLTDDGQELVGIARQMLDLEQAMAEQLGRQRSEPSGLVRLGCSVAFSVFLVPRLPLLLQRFDALSLELVVNDQPMNVIESRLDLAIRFAPVDESSLVMRALFQGHRIVVATPQYLALRGEPRTPDELHLHDCLTHAGMDGDWPFTGPSGRVSQPIRSRLRSNNMEVLHAAALQSQGIALLPELRVFDDLRTGRLRHLLADYQTPLTPAFLVYPSRRHLSSRTRVVIDFLLEQVKDIDSLLSPASTALSRPRAR